MTHTSPFYLQKGNVFALPILHYSMEIAYFTRQAFLEIQPSCVAVELAETMSLQLLHAASRLPDVSLVSREDLLGRKVYLSEPCDASFEALRSALELGLPAFCIDLEVDDYPLIPDLFPDPYSAFKLGYKKYYDLCKTAIRTPPLEIDQIRELYMAKRLKELSLRYDRVFFVGGFYHIERILNLLDRSSFPIYPQPESMNVQISTPDEASLKNILAETGWITRHYEEAREKNMHSPPDRQKLILKLYKEAGKHYQKEHKYPFPGYHLRNTMKFARNYAIIKRRLLPDFFQILSSAKGCVDSNYAYEVWKLASDYPFYSNVDQLPEESISPDDIWGNSKTILFNLKRPSRKAFPFLKARRDKANIQYKAPNPFSICSYPPEDVIIENFGHFLKRKGTQLLSEEGAKTVPFSSSLEDGIDTRETIRHFSEKKLYVKTKGKPPGGVGSVVVIFDEDSAKENESHTEKYPWLTTWIGEHNQESDMAFFATDMHANIIGPGIAECEYGGFLMSYPPRRLMDIWNDPDYDGLRTKSEVLLAAAIDYAQKPLIVYVANKPPRSLFKSFALRYGKKIVYIPIGQLAPITLQKLRKFHVLDGRDKRGQAAEYID